VVGTTEWDGWRGLLSLRMRQWAVRAGVPLDGAVAVAVPVMLASHCLSRVSGKLGPRA
jgi:hypothetical protein